METLAFFCVLTLSSADGCPALAFDGIDDRVFVPNFAYVLSEFTIEAYVWRNESTD